MKKVFKTLFPLIVIVHLLIGIIWLAIAWSIVWSVFWLMTSPANWVVRFRQMTYLVYPLLLIGVIAAAIFFKTLIFGIYEIPTGSMEKTLVPGDVVWVNNMTYGPRLPYSPYEISWVNVLVWWIQGRNADMTKHWWNYNRLNGYSEPKHGDVVVFNHPKKKDTYVKRLMALPGDTLQIVEGSIFINGELHPAAAKALFYSKISFQNEQFANFLHDSLRLQTWRKNKSGFTAVPLKVAGTE
ncbi:MAG TPA: signal peptidase I [Marinilabiliaceae bacterium]|nr:signal peptidase I [Marinilabiliaceae bacterium]